ncbi:MAG: hypothetical protein A2172_04150 [Candidatus Woykebacteria bacterium RBG_13_40_15]|uniref:Uncharacterized protein n=1 Tax=Candidatus Woykebacteria bacterium RBG_13_40_15 TaxID=1802593 RepID=A0A1G1W6R6_9BACT|nr:MAG: hypothetical protein A2172_04150 [Candidatus Woykebacteria bacterium RBG_13_40_15]
MDQGGSAKKQNESAGMSTLSIKEPTDWQETVDATRIEGGWSGVSAQRPTLWALDGRIRATERLGTR